MRAVIPAAPADKCATAGPRFAATDIRAAFGARNPCNRCVHDRIRARAMHVHGHGLD
jgi:hypothetical protein